MAKHLIFFIHGMGKHEKAWSEDARKILKKAYEDAIPKGKFEGRFERVEILYDSVFEEQRKSWANQAASLTGDVGLGWAGLGIRLAHDR